jgi:hypothetical protein
MAEAKRWQRGKDSARWWRRQNGGGELLTRGGDGQHRWLMASGGGGGLPSMVSVRGMTKEVKGDVWVHQRQLGADGGGGGGRKIRGSGRGAGGSNLFFYHMMCHVLVGFEDRRLGVS